MTLWFVLALMTAAAIFAVLWPLSRRESALRSGSDVNVYRDQLEEIRRDHAAGLIGESEAAAAQVEVSRRLLAAADAEAAVSQPAPDTATGRRRAVAVVALVLLPVGAIALYLAVGSPLLPGQPLTSRGPAERQTIAQMVAQVESHLAKNPNEGRGWEVVAPIYLRLGRFEDAVKARRQALALSEPTAERHAGLGEALTAAANGIVTAEALAAFKQALALDADHIKARFFLGLAAEQDGRVDEAVVAWRALIERAPPDAPWAEFIRAELKRVMAGAGAPAGDPSVAPSSAPSSGPSEEQVAAAKNLPPEQQVAMIKGMVERLAERLGKDGSDVEGWLRLVRSYMVLGERERALAAAGDARRALAGEPDKLKRIDELVKGLGLDG
jgi:cytochrome c-type biogenesis protein CcmH